MPEFSGQVHRQSSAKFLPGARLWEARGGIIKKLIFREARSGSVNILRFPEPRRRKHVLCLRRAEPISSVYHLYTVGISSVLISIWLRLFPQGPYLGQDPSEHQISLYMPPFFCQWALCSIQCAWLFMVRAGHNKQRGRT